MNIIEITNKFPTELDAIKHFEKARWHGKVICPYCGSENKGIRNKDHRFHCKECKKTYSVTTGTKLHNTRMPLKTWLYAFGVISDAKKGMSAKQLERNLGIHYETAWSMYQRIREIMVEQIDLDGIVEMDEAYIGGDPRYNLPRGVKDHRPFPELDKKYNELIDKFDIKKGEYKKPHLTEKSKRGRGTLKTPVAGIVQRNGDVIAHVMTNTSHTELKKLVKKYVDMPDSLLLTDDYKGYKRFDTIIHHVAIDHNKLYSYRGLNTNTIESFWAVVKRGINGQYHNVSDKYLQNYIDEFCFKWNNRNDDDMFETLINNSMTKQGVKIKRNTSKLVSKNEKHIEMMNKKNSKIKK